MLNKEVKKMENYFVTKRLELKHKIVDILATNPDMSEDALKGIISKQTGMRHTTIQTYINELKAEGLI